MTTEIPCPLSPVSSLSDRFDDLHSRMALLRDVCAMMATENCSQVIAESISREGWRGLFLLGEEAATEIEELNRSLPALLQQKTA